MIEARDVPDAGTVGDIYALRAFHLGAVGIITDGALRDTEAIAELGKPVYHRASHGSTWGRRHMPFSHDEPITCAGVFVEPGDIIVGDTDGAEVGSSVVGAVGTAVGSEVGDIVGEQVPGKHSQMSAPASK